MRESTGNAARGAVEQASSQRLLQALNALTYVFASTHWRFACARTIEQSNLIAVCVRMKYSISRTMSYRA